MTLEFGSIQIAGDIIFFNKLKMLQVKKNVKKLTRQLVKDKLEKQKKLDKKVLK